MGSDPFTALHVVESNEMSNITHYTDHVGANQSKVFKSTLFRSERLMLGLNCLNPGQEQHPHVHGGQDKFYFVVEGKGSSSWATNAALRARGWSSGRRRT